MANSCFMYVDMSFPVGTEGVSEEFVRDCDEREGRLWWSFEDWYGWSDEVLADVLPHFSVPLEDVPGLRLHAAYESVVDRWMGVLDINDGNVTYGESEYVMTPHPVSECPFGYKPGRDVDREPIAYTHDLGGGITAVLQFGRWSDDLQVAWVVTLPASELAERGEHPFYGLLADYDSDQYEKGSITYAILKDQTRTGYWTPAF